MRIILFLLYTICFTASPAQSQSRVLFDYKIRDIELFEIIAGSNERQKVYDLGAYMYDIGPAPVFQFDVHIEQLYNPSPNARKAQLDVDQYMLLVSKESHTFINVDSMYKDVNLQVPMWTYQSPVKLAFTCSETKLNVVCTSDPITPQFMAPNDPLTSAKPHAFHILGYAYRFVLLPSEAKGMDQDPTNNAYQVTFMKR